MPIISRSQVDHPALGTAGGAGLHTSIEAIYTKLGDNSNSRWFIQNALADTASQDFEHNFKTAFGEIIVFLYLRDTGTGELTRINSLSSPALSSFSIVATPSFETTKVRVTNNSGAARDIAVVILHGNDLDYRTTPPEDGQALVWSATLGKFVPGASGDSSFKIQSVTDPNAVIKGGYIGLDDGRELATHDGAGSLSTDFGGDLTVNLDTILGSNPADATSYHLYIDIDSLGAAVTQTDTGRKVIPVVQANFVLLTTKPDAVNKSRYVHRGFLRSADSGTVWSGTGSKFGTLAFLKHDNGPVAVSPVVYRLAKQAVGTIGSSGQIRAGHLLSEKSFGSLTVANRHYYNLVADANDDSVNSAINLTNNGTTPFTGTDMFGVASAAASLDGTDDSFSSTNAFFNPGDADFAFGGWFNAVDWTPGALDFLISQSPSGSDRGFGIQLSTLGVLTILTADSASNSFDVCQFSAASFTGFHHIVARYIAATNLWRLYVDGKLVASESAGVAQRTTTATAFVVGARGTTNTDFFAGIVREVFFQTGDVTDEDIRRLYAYQLTHSLNLDPQNQEWNASIFAAATVEDGDTWLVDKNNKSDVFVDFSELPSGAQVDLTCASNNLTAVVVPAVPPYDQTFGSNPTFPITHGLTGVPVLEVAKETSSGVWEWVSPEGMISATSTQITGSVQTLFDASALQVRIRARVGNDPTGVSEATAAALGTTKKVKWETRTQVGPFNTNDQVIQTFSGLTPGMAYRISVSAELRLEDPDANMARLFIKHNGSTSLATGTNIFRLGAENLHTTTTDHIYIVGGSHVVTLVGTTIVLVTQFSNNGEKFEQVVATLEELPAHAAHTFGS